MSRYQPAWSVALPRLLYTHNPFYLISALLVLYGLHRSTSVAADWQAEALTIGSLFGYTLLLALAAFAVVQMGKVWDDARTIMLIVVLLFLAISVRFDAIALDNPARGAKLLGAGFVFAVSISEGLLHGLRIRLAAMYRVPYYVLLALLFSYPIWLAKLSVAGHDHRMAWGVFLFPVVASAGMLMLLPAARYGGPPGLPSGTPWSWPWYPWSLFAVILIGLGLRSYWLSVSFQVGQVSDIGFRSYFLIPLGLATAILLFELATAANNQTMRRVALWTPLALLLVAFPGSGGNRIAIDFLHDLCRRVGSPAQLTLAGLVVFYGIAWARGLSIAQWGVIGCLMASAWIDTKTVSLSTLAVPRMWPLICVAAIQFGLAYRHNQLWRTPLPIAISLFVAWHSAWQFWPTELGIYCFTHTLVVGLLLAPVIVDDRFSRRVRWLAAAAIPVVALVALISYDTIFAQIPRSLDAGYLSTLVAVSLLYWYRSATVANLVEMLSTVLVLGIAQLRQLMVLIANTVLAKGWPWLTWGLAFLVFALAISSMKGGASKTIVRNLARLNDRLRNVRPSQ
jgi:hypothetical protein